MRCNTCKQFCILFVQKLGASGVAVGEVCSLMACCSENGACSSILDFLHRLNYRVGSAYEKSQNCNSLIWTNDTQEVISCFAASSVNVSV